jgi:hypothetical protein
MKGTAGEEPELLAETPRLENALGRRDLHPGFEIVPVGFRRRRVSSDGHARLPLAGRVGKHDDIVPKSRIQDAWLYHLVR